MNARRLVTLYALLAALALAAGGASATGSPPQESKTAIASGEGKRLFTAGTTPSCATCHALRDAGATGNIGPDLDTLKPDAARVQNAVQNGFENMPAFGSVLSAAQVDALARYVAGAAGGAK